MHDVWRERWQTGRTGWHEAAGNAGLKAHWPQDLPAASRVLVPLCGRSPDLLWLVDQGCEVVGVELSEIPVQQLFAEQNLEYVVEQGAGIDRYSATEIPLTLYCGDYFTFTDHCFDALYDRGALVAMPESIRPNYVRHTESLLRPDATRLIITLEYDQAIVQGPPYAVNEAEILAYWPNLERVAVTDDIENCPPKFRHAGLKHIEEIVWLSAKEQGV